MINLMTRVKFWINFDLSLKITSFSRQHSYYSSYPKSLLRKTHFHQISLKFINNICNHNLIHHHPHSKSSTSVLSLTCDEVASISKLNSLESLNSGKIKNTTIKDQSCQLTPNKLNYSPTSIQNSKIKPSFSFCSSPKETLYSIKKKNRAYVMSPIFEEPTFTKLVNNLIQGLGTDYEQACFILHYFKYFKPCYFSRSGVVRFIEELESIIQFCKLYFSKKDIIESHHLLTMRLETIRNRVSILIEFGLKNLKPNHILNYVSLINYNESELKKMGVIEENTNVIQNLLNCLSTLSPNEKTKIKDKLNSNWSLIKIKSEVCKLYLEIRYKSSSHFNYVCEINKIPISRYHQVVESVRRLNLSNIQAFTTFRSLFFIESTELNFIFNQFPQLFDDELLKVILIKSDINKYSLPLIVNNTLLLKNKYKLSNKQIDICPRSLTISSNLLEERLDYLVNFVGSQILKADYILPFAVLPSSFVDQNLKKIKEFSALTEINFFLNEILKPKLTDCYTYKSHISEVVYFLSKELNVESHLIKNELVSHPFRKYINLDDSKQVWEYLISLKCLSKNQLIKGMPILVYDVSLVKSYFNKFKLSNVYKEWINHDMILSYLVYMIEKDRKMDGSGSLIGKLVTPKKNLKVFK